MGEPGYPYTGYLRRPPSFVLCTTPDGVYWYNVRSCAATSDTAQAMQKLGLSVSSYATFTFILTIVTALVCFFVSGVIFWRKSDDWMALLVALTVVATDRKST